MDDVHAGRWQRILNSLMLRLASPLRRLRNTSGQSMVEYSLIAVLVALAIGTTIVLTKGAIGNVFSNTVYNLISGHFRWIQDKYTTCANLCGCTRKLGSNQHCS